MHRVCKTVYSCILGITVTNKVTLLRESYKNIHIPLAVVVMLPLRGHYRHYTATNSTTVYYYCSCCYYY